jgi:transketolase
LEFCDVATGSLGQGLGFTCGEAYSSKYFDKIPNKYFCIIGDGELAEGSNWEAAAFASYYKLDNLIAIVDANRLGQSMPTQIEHDCNNYKEKFAAFGFETVVVDGHNVSEIVSAFNQARNTTGRPFAIIAKTFKGKYFLNDVENVLNWHGKPMGAKSENIIANLKSLMKNHDITLKCNLPKFEYKYPSANGNGSQVVFDFKPNYDGKKEVSTREAYGNALKRLGAVDVDNQIIALDADVKNSTFSEHYEKVYPQKFINCFIAEQNLVSVGLGVSKRNKIPFCSTFAVFFTRAFDQIRMGAISFANLKFFGSHSGVHIGQDGPSQMGLEVIRSKYNEN